MIAILRRKKNYCTLFATHRVNASNIDSTVLYNGKQLHLKEGTYFLKNESLIQFIYIVEIKDDVNSCYFTFSTRKEHKHKGEKVPSTKEKH